MNLNCVPDETLAEIREVLKQGLPDEAACLITSDWKIIPLNNTAENPGSLVEPSIDDHKLFISLLYDKKLFGWAHSHPHWHAIPSTTDIINHQFPINMLIYSVRYDEMRLYSPLELRAVTTPLNKQERPTL